jgi:hypothetical protein
MKSNYELDRLDLTVKTTLDYNTQQAVTNALRLLNQPSEARNAGIVGFRMLNENTDLTPIVYSLMLFERSKTGNLLRVQTDNYEQPLDINEGIRLDLGSTSKLRTMVHYLELITDTYEQYKGRTAKELGQIELHPRDYLSAWVIEQLRATPTISLEDLLIRLWIDAIQRVLASIFLLAGVSIILIILQKTKITKSCQYVMLCVIL